MVSTSAARRQVNVRVESDVYDQLAAQAKRDRRSIPQTARLLLRDALSARRDQPFEQGSDVGDLAALATAGGAFDWVAEEPEIYAATSGEPL